MFIFPSQWEKYSCIVRRLHMYLNMNANRKKKRQAGTQDSEALQCLSDALVQAYRTFNSVSDPVVMDACIFEINALRARRNSLLREMRAQAQSGGAAQV